MINAVSRAYLRASSQAVPNGLKPVVLGTTQGKRVVVPSKTEKNAPCGNTRASTALQCEYTITIRCLEEC